MRGVTEGPIGSNLMYRRGSEWRRWDLHVHTPYSALNNGFGDDFDQYAKTLFERAIEKRIAVIGVTDYFTVAGYRDLSALQQDEERLTDLLGEGAAASARRIRLLPNIEFRLSDIVQVGAKSTRVNMHVIFSEGLSADTIEDHLLHRLEFAHESRPDGSDGTAPLTIPQLEKLGKRLKQEHPNFSGMSDLEVGMTQAVVRHDQITEILQKHHPFAKRYLLVLEDPSNVSWEGQGHLSRKLLVKKSHMLFSSNPSAREFGLGRRHPSEEAFKAEFHSLKPCIHGSDAHCPDDLFEFAEDRQLWICADPSFNGLAQVLHAPAERVFIGSEPPALARIRDSTTKSIDLVRFTRVAGTQQDPEWFSGSLPLNAGLVAVIGKKGSGKSALAEIIGLVGNAASGDDVSFLTTKRFLNTKQRLGEKFEAEILWRSGDSDTRRLDEKPDASLPARVKHIPQQRLERICDEIQESPGPSRFDHELESVIFSHVPQAERLGLDRLRLLLDHTTSEQDARVQDLQRQLDQANREYIDLLERSSDKARRALEANLEQKQTELKAHDQAKPAAIPKPGDPNGSSGGAQAEQDLAKVVAHIEKLDVALEALRGTQATMTKRRVAAERLLTRVENFKTKVEEFYAQSGADAELLDMDPHDILSATFKTTALEALRARAVEEIEKSTAMLDSGQPGSKARERADTSKTADEIRHKLSEPERRYQEYQRALTTWEKKRDEIQGNANDATSIAGLEAQISQLDKLPEQISDAVQRRTAVLQEIFQAKSAVLAEYRRLYAPVVSFIGGQGVAEDVNALGFSVAMVVDGLPDKLLGMIHHGKRGTFQGEFEGRERLGTLIERHDFTSPEGVAEFTEDLERHLVSDVRQEANEPVDLAAQLKSGATVLDVYNYVFGLDYLRPRYELSWRGKPLNQLSPGERGTLLLIFYLLIDRDSRPLVIDQPEENLDNETVAELLVPAIKYAKARRQIIMVTHNPNLAVVCDADQIVHASIDKTNGNRITYTAGAIEAPAINQMIIDVLEGTKPAFDLRDEKYDVVDRADALNAAMTP